MIKFLTKHSRVLFLGAFASLAVSFNACTDIDNTLGDDFIDPSMKGSVLIDSSFVIDSYTVSTDRFPTSLSGKCYVGIYNDPVFGQVSSSLVTQLYPGNFLQYADTIHALKSIVSINLTLKLKGGIGDSLSRQKLRVYLLTEILKVDSTYYSDFNIAKKIAPITKEEVEYDRKADNIVTIKLDDEFANRLLDRETIKKLYATFKTDNKTTMQQIFSNTFKGLYIENTSIVTGNGGLNAIDFADTSSRVLIEYKVVGKTIPDSTVRTTFKIGTLNRFNVVDHVYNGSIKPTSLNPNLSTNPTSNELVYLQGFGGLRTKLMFNPTSTAGWDKKGYKIHRAELVVEPYFPNGELNYKKMPSAISAYYPSATKKDTMVVVPDMSIFKGISTNAFYNRSRRLYSLNITTYFKDVMRDPSKPKFVYLYAGVPATVYNSQNGGYNPFELAGEFLSSPTQVILGKPGKPNHVKLIITYSK